MDLRLHLEYEMEGPGDMTRLSAQTDAVRHLQTRFARGHAAHSTYNVQLLLERLMMTGY